MDNLKNLTIIIVTYKTEKRILYNCIKSIDANIKIIVVENSNNEEFKSQVLKDFENVDVILSNTNLGYGGGNNLGLKYVKTNFVMISNPDTVYDKNFFKNLSVYLNSNIKFSIIGASYNDENYLPYGSFDSKLNKYLKKIDYDDNNLKEVDWVVGCTMILNLKEINFEKVFDDSFFLFYDETDLCFRVKSKNGKIYNSSKLIVDHLGHKSSQSSDPRFKIKSEKLRNWHLMWSSFYYHKKHYGYFFSVRKNIGKLFRSFFKMLYFKIKNEEEKKVIYKYRFLGLINSMIGKNSWYRINDN